MHLALGCKYLLLDSHRLYFSIKALQSLLYLIDLNSLDLELFIEELFLRNIGSPYFYEFMILKNTDTSLKSLQALEIARKYLGQTTKDLLGKLTYLSDLSKNENTNNGYNLNCTLINAELTDSFSLIKQTIYHDIYQCENDFIIALK